MKTNELTGAQLDYWTARAEGVPAAELSILPIQRSTGHVCVRSWKPGILPRHDALQYSSAWHQGGPLFDRIADLSRFGGGWSAVVGHGDVYARGATPLQAVCRALVRAAFGAEVEEVRVCE